MSKEEDKQLLVNDSTFTYEHTGASSVKAIEKNCLDTVDQVYFVEITFTVTEISQYQLLFYFYLPSHLHFSLLGHFKQSFSFKNLKVR